MGDEERTKDRRQTCRKLGSVGLGAWMETHNGQSNLSKTSSGPFGACGSNFFMWLTDPLVASPTSTLTPSELTSPTIWFQWQKMQKARVRWAACSDGDTHSSNSRSSQQSAASSTSSEFIIHLGKQRGVATVLGAGMTLLPSEYKHLRKAAVLHLPLLPSAAGAMLTQPVDYWT
jgi:hypothetical protein